LILATQPQSRFSDLDLDFTINPLTKDVSLKYDAEAVKRSLRNLIFTQRYERLFQPDINSGINNILFENFGSIQVVTLRNRIEQTIVNFEPRVTEVIVNVYENQELHYLTVEIQFRVRNVPGLQELSLDLQRVR
jgi:phage baseplate assembly protein W